MTYLEAQCCKAMAVSSWVQTSGVVTLGGPAWEVLGPQVRCLQGPPSGRAGFQQGTLTELLAQHLGSSCPCPHGTVSASPSTDDPGAALRREPPVWEDLGSGVPESQGHLCLTSDGQKPSAIQALLEWRRRGIGRPLCREGESGNLWTHFKADPSASLSAQTRTAGAAAVTAAMRLVGAQERTAVTWQWRTGWEDKLRRPWGSNCS